MKYAFIVPDGAADHKVEALGNRTPLEAARTPNMDRLARDGYLGLARTIPAGMKPGSDVGHLSLLGYDPVKYLTGRAPIEAAAMRIQLGPQTSAFRCNTVTTSPDGRTMLDYSAGHITTEEARALITDLGAALRDKKDADLKFHPGVEYRHIMTWEGWPDSLKQPDTTPPHDISGKDVAPNLPRGPGAERLVELMMKSRLMFAKHPVNEKRVKAGKRPATQIWLWGSGKASSVTPLGARYQVPEGRGKRGLRPIRGGAISAVDIVRGLAVLAGLDIVDAPGQTAYYDTDYASTGRAAVKALSGSRGIPGDDGLDMIYIHVEAPDEATHEGLTDKKIEAIEKIDSEIVGPVVAALEKGGEPFRVMISPDHATTLATKTHANDPVPFILYGHGVEKRPGVAYNEPCAMEVQGRVEPVAGHELLGRLLAP